MKNTPRWTAEAIPDALPGSTIWLVLALLLVALVAGGVILGSRPASGSVPQPARTDAEAILFLATLSCPRCRSTGAPWRHNFVGPERKGAPVKRGHYTGRCQTCRLTRNMRITLPAHDAGPGLFGGPERSALLDAGQWLAYVDAQARPGDDGPPTRNALRTAAAAIDEVIKFIPAGQDRVCRDDLHAGLAYFDTQPERFERSELVRTRAALLRRALIS